MSKLKQIVKEVESALGCNCDLSNWYPSRDTGHTCVCRIHKAAIHLRDNPDDELDCEGRPERVTFRMRDVQKKGRRCGMSKCQMCEKEVPEGKDHTCYCANCLRLEQRIEKLREGCESLAIQEGCSVGEDCDQTCVIQYKAGMHIIPCAGCFAQIVLEADDELAKGGNGE